MSAGGKKGATEFWLVRHTAVDVPLGMCYGRSDVPLRESFAREAAAVRDALHGVDFDAVMCSPLSRCVRLAEACGYGGAVRDERLLEIDFGDWELRYFDRIDDPQLERWYGDWLHERPTGGESFDEQRARVATFLEELRGRPREESRGRTRRILVFTHGGVMVAAGIYAGLLHAGEAFSKIPPYGSIIKISL